MFRLGLVGTEMTTSEEVVRTEPALQLHLEDTFASARRLWLRGRLLVAGAPSDNIELGWWERLWGKADVEKPLPTLHLETRVSGLTLTTDIPLQADGHFEATFVTDLPPARRGWRVARHRVTFAEHHAEACSLVLSPPADASAVVVVVLPLASTREPAGIQHLVGSDLAEQLRPLFQQLQRQRGHYPAFYLACVPPAGGCSTAEVALALTSVGWPAGNILLLPGQAGDLVDTLTGGLDRLRWLFADSLDLLVLNLEPKAIGACTAVSANLPDRAAIRRVVQPHEDPWTLFEHLDRDSSRRQAFGPRPLLGRRVPQHPLVFCHGMLAYSTIRMSVPENPNYFTVLGTFLRERGCQALFPRVTPAGGVVERAQQMSEQIKRWTSEPVNIIAHSMGGLDARYLITHLGMADQVRSLTTISTPHRGTYLADWFLDNFRSRVPLMLALEAMGVNLDGFHDCRPATCVEFNVKTPNMPQVTYFSYGGAVPALRVTPPLRRGWQMLTALEGPNDGMVSLASARWGEFLGVVAADHFAQTPDAVFLHPREDFDSLGFFSSIVEDLARRGF